MKILITFFTVIFSLNMCYGLKPESIYINLPSDFGIPYKSEIIKTNDGYNLNTWIFEPSVIDSNTQTVIITNSDAGNMSYNITYAAYLQYRGFRVVTFDYRGFGKSSSFKIDTSAFYYQEFETDLQSVIKNIANKYKTKVSILAFSLGSIVTLNSQKEVTSMINKFIFDGLVSNPKELILRAQKLKNKKIIPYNFNQDINNINNKNALVFVGNEDKFTTLEDACEFQSINTNTEIIIYSGNHLESATKLNSKYFDYITVFLSN